ncbi:MAG: transcription antitermination protein NusB [bacterium]|nr:transcription antitermination protein NusB [bacterium]
MDDRHSFRVKTVQELYSHLFNNNSPQEFDEKTLQIIKNKQKINDLIHEFAPKFPIVNIAKIDLAIMQLSIYDLVIEKKEPPKVIINEAIELAKEMGSDRSFAFINAVLGKIFDKYTKHD